MRTLVLGAGVVGVSTAYHLARAGHRVVVIDREAGAGLETSFANGGQISASHADPWAGPGTPWQALKWLGREDAPLILRPRWDPALFAWLLRFLANCRPSAWRRNVERILRIAVYSRQCMADLRQTTGIVYDGAQRGILHVYFDHKSLDDAVKKAAAMTELGCYRDPLDVAGCIAREPALAPARDRLTGGTYTPDDESGDAHKFATALAEICRGMGVDFRYGVTVRRLVGSGDRVMSVMTDGGTFSSKDFDAFVLCLGSYSPQATKPLGIRLPVYPAKGYSVTLPVSDPARAPEVALIDDSRKIVYARLGDRLRIAGTAEFTGYDSSLNQIRAGAVLDAALDLFPGCGDPAKAELWAGLRPQTPDHVPIIGATPYRNLFLNTGHGTLGWTMAAGSGRAVADLVGGRGPDIDLAGLGLDRFS